MKSPDSNSDTSNTPGTAAQAQDQAHGLLDQATTIADQAKTKAQDLLNQVPDTLKDAGEKTAGAFKNLTTTQKIVGGALLAAGLAYLVAPKKKGKGKRAAAALDQLLLFVNDRIEGYKRAANETKDGDLRSYYQQLVVQSQRFAADLNAYLTREGGERETGTTLKGKLYRKLMDAQAAVTGHNEKAILATNVFGERWALRAYKKALRRKAIKGELRTAVQRQYKQSKQTYKKLKELMAQH